MTKRYKPESDEDIPDYSVWPARSENGRFWLPDADADVCGYSVEDAVATAVLTATLLPFVQAIATNAGQDVYAAVRGLLSRDKQEIMEESMRFNGYVEVVDRETGTGLEVHVEITREAAAQLGAIDLTAPIVQRTMLTWNSSDRRWEASLRAYVNDERHRYLDREIAYWDGQRWQPLQPDPPQARSRWRRSWR